MLMSIISKKSKNEVLPMNEQEIERFKAYFKKRMQSIRNTLNKPQNKHLNEFLFNELKELKELEKILENLK